MRSAEQKLKIYCRQVEEAKPFITVQLQLSERSKWDLNALSFDTGTHRHDKMVLIHFLLKRKKNQFYNAVIELETYTINSLSGHRILLKP